MHFCIYTTTFISHNIYSCIHLIIFYQGFFPHLFQNVSVVDDGRCDHVGQIYRRYERNLRCESYQNEDKIKLAIGVKLVDNEQRGPSRVLHIPILWILNRIENPGIHNGVHPVVDQLVKKDQYMKGIKSPFRRDIMAKKLDRRTPVKKGAVFVKSFTVQNETNEKDVDVCDIYHQQR